jgi:hypothetical protein
MEAKDTRPAKKDTLQANDTFLHFLGMFYAAWTSIDMTIDYALGRFLNLPHSEALLLTSGMQFGPKIRLLYEIIRGSDNSNKSALLGALNKLRNESKRNVFAHSYLLSSKTEVMFLERTSGGDFQIKPHIYTLDQWVTHVKAFGDAGSELWTALGSPRAGFDAFAEAAFNEANN